MSWVAVTDLDNEETGCVWSDAIVAIEVERTEGRHAVQVTTGNGVMFIVGVFDDQPTADNTMQALALHLEAERKGVVVDDVNLVKAQEVSSDGRPDKLPLGPQSMRALADIDVLGGCATGSGLDVAPVVLRKMVPRYLTPADHHEGDLAGETTYTLTDEAKKVLATYRHVHYA